MKDLDAIYCAARELPPEQQAAYLAEACADDAALRANRLALLRSLHAAMNRVADLSKLAA